MFTKKPVKHVRDIYDTSEKEYDTVDYRKKICGHWISYQEAQPANKYSPSELRAPNTTQTSRKKHKKSNAGETVQIGRPYETPVDAAAFSKQRKHDNGNGINDVFFDIDNFNEKQPLANNTKKVYEKPMHQSQKHQMYDNRNKHYSAKRQKFSDDNFDLDFDVYDDPYEFNNQSARKPVQHGTEFGNQMKQKKESEPFSHFDFCKDDFMTPKIMEHKRRNVNFDSNYLNGLYSEPKRLHEAVETTFLSPKPIKRVKKNDYDEVFGASPLWNEPKEKSKALPTQLYPEPKRSHEVVDTPFPSLKYAGQTKKRNYAELLSTSPLWNEQKERSKAFATQKVSHEKTLLNIFDASNDFELINWEKDDQRNVKRDHDYFKEIVEFESPAMANKKDIRTFKATQPTVINIKCNNLIFKTN